MIDKEIVKPLDAKWVAKNAPEKRIIIWQVALVQVGNKPIGGYGLDNFQEVYTSYFINHPPTVANDAFENKRNLAVTRAHNYILDLLVFSGVGGIIWIYFVFFLFKKAKKDIFFIALLIYVLWVQIQIQSVIHLIYFWALAAMISAQYPLNEAHRKKILIIYE
jgi:O-antigen ligase